MLKKLKKHVEKLESDLAVKKADADLNRIRTLTETYLKAQEIKDPELRERALAEVRRMLVEEDSFGTFPYQQQQRYEPRP